MGGTGTIDFAATTNTLGVSAGGIFVPGYNPNNAATTLEQGLTVNPSNVPSTTTNNSIVTLATGSFFDVNLTGATGYTGATLPSTSLYLNVPNGGVSLNGATLVVSATGTLTVGESFLLIDPTKLSGAFASSTGTINGMPYVVTYNNGISGADVVLTIVPEPSTLTLAALAVGALAARQIRRRRRKAAI